jgi:acetyl-CoA carboxylase biotin carboxyl carrier protein
VWKVITRPGDKVASGDTLAIVESMKMEIPVITEDGGTVKEILVKEKDPVAEGQVVAVLEE